MRCNMSGRFSIYRRFSLIICNLKEDIQLALKKSNLSRFSSQRSTNTIWPFIISFPNDSIIDRQVKNKIIIEININNCGLEFDVNDVNRLYSNNILKEPAPNIDNFECYIDIDFNNKYITSNIMPLFIIECISYHISTYSYKNVFRKIKLNEYAAVYDFSESINEVNFGLGLSRLIKVREK